MKCPRSLNNPNASSGLIIEPVRVQTFVAQSSVEAFDVGILRGLAWLNELQPYPALFTPGGQRSTTKLRAVIQHYRFR